MHCTAKAKTAHTFVTKLKEGNIYTINQFVVIPNTEEYRIMKRSAYIIEFHGGTTVRKSLVKSDGFVRHPFDLIAFDDLQVTDNKHLIEERGQSVRVTLWGSLGDVLIDKKTRNTGLHAVVLTAVNPKLYNNKLYLLSSSSTIILDAGEIPALKAEIHESMEIIPAENFEVRDGTLENLLIWARNRKNEFVTFNCHVTIDDIRTRKGWNYPSCGSDKCRKGTTRREGKFWCDSCNKPTDYPVVRYRLELDVSDDTARTVVVLFDELSYQLVKYSAQSLLKEEDESNYNIVIEDSDTETVPAVSEVPEDDDDSEPAAKKKLKGIAIEESDTETVLDVTPQFQADITVP
ncbi:hypothetical protein OROHE_002594 [Orobanche hederae]